AGDVPPEVLARVANGDPVLLKVPFGQATLVLSLAPDMPWSWAKRVICYVADLDESSVKLETTRSGWGTMALCAAGKARPVPAWTDPETLASKFLAGASIEARADEGPSPPGTTVNGALCVPFSLDPAEERTATFFVTWHFPNVERFGHQGNFYCEMFRDAMDAARYVAANLKGLTARTFLYHQTVYQSNIPEEFLDAITSQSVILRGPTCWRSAEGYFGGYEGAYRCCPLNCTHVWNYAQTHARLFPEIGRNMRVSDFLTYLHESGETSHRQHAKTNAFADGHCACIEAAFREHTLSPDDSFLRGIYPNVKKAMEWFIKRYDKAEEGVTRTHQWNTYDTAVSGLNTFIGSQYLSALAASEAMARAMGDDAAAARWRALRERGSRTQNESLWGGAYYVQIPEDPPAHDYNNGCHSDQLLGQWWAHQLNLGYLYPRARVKQACESIFKYNFKKDFTGLPQVPRRYVDDGDGGLYMCTWPNDDRPDPFTLYSVEVWTGIEYSTAGLMVFEGLVDQARTIVRTARARYDGRPRQRLNSGAGVCGAGNPFQELECGKFYARAQSSWALLIACQGLVLDGPAGILGFKPRWEPDDHRSFFTVPEGWGLFVQRREGGRQTERLELRHGRARVKELVFESPAGAPPPERCIVRLNGRHRRAQLSAADDGEVRIVLSRALRLVEGDVLEVIIRPATK
ncbi:MAG: GH116 family glycosyl hydrolase, partial [Armatimonadota bacterium]